MDLADNALAKGNLCLSSQIYVTGLSHISSHHYRITLPLCPKQWTYCFLLFWTAQLVSHTAGFYKQFHLLHVNHWSYTLCATILPALSPQRC